MPPMGFTSVAQQLAVANGCRTKDHPFDTAPEIAVDGFHIPDAAAEFNRDLEFPGDTENNVPVLGNPFP